MDKLKVISDQQNQTSLLGETIGLLGYFFVHIICIFILELVFIVFFKQYLVLFFFTGKIYLYSGLLGCIIELASKQTPYFQWSNFHSNVKKFWTIYLAVTILQFSILFSSGIIFPKINSHAPAAFIAGIQIVLSYLLASWMISIKYFRNNHFAGRAINLNGSTILTIIGFFLFDMILYYVPKLILFKESYWPLILSLIAKCLFFAEFIYLSILILNQYPELENRFTNKKEIYLINPCFGGVFKGLVSIFLQNYPPVFVVLKALTPKDYRFVEFNKKLWQKRYYKPSKLVAITCFSSNCYEAYAIAKEFKKRGSKVVLGGPHVTYLPDEALTYCDSVVIGEVEGVWRDIIKDYENNSLKSEYTGVLLDDFHKEVHQELLHSPPNVIKDFLEPTRGCKYRCDFCTIPVISDGKVRKKPINDVVELIKKIRPKYRHIIFLDNNIYNDPAYSKELFKALKPLDIKWSGFCTIDIAKNEELLRLAKESGCFMLVFGYEIFGDSLESRQKGKFTMADRYIQYSKMIKKHGINIRGNFMAGWDSDNFKTIFQLWKFSLKLHPLIALLGLVTPFPGTRLYSNMLKEDRLTNLNWRQYDGLNFVLKHENLNNTFFSEVFFFLFPATFFLTTSKLGWLLLSFFCAYLLTGLL